MSTIAERLKPCPFCNGSDIAINYGAESMGIYFVCCRGCGTEGPLAQAEIIGVGEASAESEAMDMWNRRPEEERMRAVLGRIAVNPSSFVRRP